MSDIKREYVDLLLNKIDEITIAQQNKIKEVAAMFFNCMDHQGVVQLFGHRLSEEFVNELNYRAGGLVPFHAIRAKQSAMEGLLPIDVAAEEYDNDAKWVDTVLSVYELDDRDMYCLVSLSGNEPFVLELARRAKEKGQKVVAVVNLESYKKNGGTLLEYADAYLDMGADEPDLAVDINGSKYGQYGTTIGSIIAQMLTAEVYQLFEDTYGKAPVLISMNIAGADAYNHELCIPYGRRVD